MCPLSIFDRQILQPNRQYRTLTSNRRGNGRRNIRETNFPLVAMAAKVPLNRWMNCSEHSGCRYISDDWSRRFWSLLLLHAGFGDQFTEFKMMNAVRDTCAFRFGWGRHGNPLALLILICLALSFDSPCDAFGQSERAMDSAAASDSAVESTAQHAFERPVDRRFADQDLVERNRLGQPPANSYPTMPADRSGQTVDQTVDQINEIRRQMGGGVAGQLEGLFDSPDQGRQQLQRQFDRQLNDLVGTSTSPPVPAVQPLPPSGSSHSVCVTLRLAARELDSVAADLEDIALYAEADQIRGNARNLRLRARMMAPGRTANAALPGGSTWQYPPSTTRPELSQDGGDLPMNPSDPRIRPRQ